jgi:hypothetical protein
MDRRGFLSLSGLAVASTVIPAHYAGGIELPAAKPKSVIAASLDGGAYRQGEVMTLTVREAIRSRRKIEIVDSSGTVWKRRSYNRDRAVFTATAGDQESNRIRVSVTRRSDGRTWTQAIDYDVKVRRPSASGPGRWPGHAPGQIMLGLSSADFSGSISRTGPIGLHRTFYNWGDAGEDRTIRADHASGRLPWVSFKPPGGTGTWAGIASGAYDNDIRARARRYAGYSKPVISTFHHEPTNDGGDPAAWAAAYVRIHDVFADENAHVRVAFAPILGDWEFNPRNRDGRPDAYLTAPVLERLPFLGIDLYQNGGNDGFRERLGRIIDWLDERGVDDPMVGIGETGCCLSEDPSPHEWLQANWDWAAANPSKIGAMSYFDSTRNSRDAHIWRLDETAAKLATYRRLLGSSKAASL